MFYAYIPFAAILFIALVLLQLTTRRRVVVAATKMFSIDVFTTMLNPCIIMIVFAKFGDTSLKCCIFVYSKE